MSLQMKLLLLIVLFLCLPFLAILYLWLQSSSATIERTAASYGEVLMKQTADYIDGYFRELERDTSLLLVMPAVQQLMQLKTQNDYAYLETTVQLQQEMQESKLNSRGDIMRIDFVSGHGVEYSTQVLASLENGEYENAMDERRNDRTYGIGNIIWQNDRTPLLSYYRYYSDYVVRDVNNMIIIYLNLIAFDEASENILLRESELLSIVSQDGFYIYHPDRMQIGQKANIVVDKKQMLVGQQQSEYTGWTYIYEIPLQQLNGQLKQMQRITMLVIVCMIAVVLLILGGFMLYLSKRIIFLRKLMRVVEEGNLHVRAPEKSKDELGMLYRSFNHFVFHIRRLIAERSESNRKEMQLQKQQEALMIEVMQTQINPHFLYNTLEVINAYAILEGIKPISSLAVALSKMLRYSVNNDEPLVNLQQELEHARWYCQIMRLSYPAMALPPVSSEGKLSGKMLEVHFALANEESTRYVACVRLALQPLIENALLHGYQTAGERTGKIEISGWREDDRYIVAIADNGSGMDPHEIDCYNQAFALSCRQIADGGFAPAKTGMWNVHRRIRLTFGDRYGLCIPDNTQAGFEIRLLLPVIEEEQHDVAAI